MARKKKIIHNFVINYFFQIHGNMSDKLLDLKQLCDGICYRIIHTR